MRNAVLVRRSPAESSAVPLSAARWLAPVIMDMDPATTDRVTATTVARPMSPPIRMVVVVTGSASVSGTAMAGGFAVCGSAANFRSSTLNDARNGAFRKRLQDWPEKTFFSGHQATDVYFGLTIVRFLAK